MLDLRQQYKHVELENRLAELEGPFCLWVDDNLKALQQIARFWRRKMNVEVIGVTGSVGKSTTKELVAEVLSRRYSTLKNKGNLNNEIGLPLTLLSLSSAHERAVLEMGFYVPGEITFLCELAQPKMGVITNVGTVHAERAGTQEMIARGKAELVRALPADGYAILNYDDPWVRPMAEMTEAHVLYYGMDNMSDLWADGVEGLGLEGIRFRLHFRDEVLYLRVPLIGHHSVQTALRAAAVGLVNGLTWQEIVEGLQSYSTQLRLITVRSEQGALLLDDTYNASPESMLSALNLLEEISGRKVAVLGDMLELGQYEWRGHEIVGIRASEVVDELITVGERGRMIAAAACRAGLPAAVITELDTVDRAIEFLQPHLLAEDVVLVKGSHSMRMDRIVAALEYSS
jgi:UDP-N-acetylmuramoyl-tripeptide--D-alanyl-D-alanine ligase